MKPSKHFIKATALLLTIICSTATSPLSHANTEAIKFIAAPTHNKSVTKNIYSPLVDYLSKTTGKKVELVLPTSFLDYSLKMRKGKFDIAFDGPHFTSWRIKKFNDTPVVRLGGNVQIVVVIPKDETNIKTLSQLAGHKVCSFPSPNLLTMSFLDHFPNPMRQPLLVDAKGFTGLQQCLANKKAKAMVLRKKIWDKINQSSYKLLQTQNISYPERTLTIASGIDSSTQEAITSAILNPAAAPHLQKLLNTFKSKSFIKASTEEYNDIYKLLSPVWGFHLP